ncbi:dimethyl sulfoxide reductase anchor subunit [Vibrio sp. SM6]|uniref:Dimethyl sulfoxide reductase anchor subunit n=1 Tax=Vibrio agarilyticus TaxID=2726741 RepID=A0A7X8TT10_9VIBR|nr:DmsC/YnfH family molybdoenzyme membrane anchor subunit [Vibrio agarilyticus]NLS13753.1 dimethyl sulfoxide reductase anchor subunit [Vibrio agarilyticus]
MHELPLVFFTVLAQAVAGSVILLTLFSALPCYRNSFSTAALTEITLMQLAVLALSGMAALTHLGMPLRAMNVVYGVFHGSAMSLEIVAVSLFGALLSGVLFLAWRDANGKILWLVRGLCAASAILALVAITRVYHLPTVPLWSSMWTWGNFALTASVAGAALLLALLHFTQVESRLIARVFLPFVIGVALVVSVHYLFALNLELVALHTHLDSFLQNALGLRFTLLVVALVLCCLPSRMFTTSPHISTLRVLSLTLILIVAELIGRVFFYELMLIGHL